MGQNAFDSIAKVYDTDKRMERGKAIADEIRLHISSANEKSAMEFGCGTGIVGMQLLDDFSSVLFVDSSPAMIEQVRQKLIRLQKPPDTAVCCDIMVEVPHGVCVDYIFTSLVLHHICDTEAILSRFYRMLHPDGRLIIVDLDSDNGSFHAHHSDFSGYHGFEQSALIDLAKRVGFRDIEAKSFYFGSKDVNGKECPYSLFVLIAEKCDG